jgi:hypothetical protein
MERRTFVKGGMAGSLMLLIEPSRLLAVASDAPMPLDRAFVHPPGAARPHTWWHWMNGNVTADGITRDLEAMARVGVGGVQMFDVGTGIPKGPVETLSPEWLRLVRHAISECNRLGLSFTMHNCPGWSSSGGPWVTPERAMQQLVWSETVVDGGQMVDVRLARPFAKLDYYRDAFIVAYPSLAGEVTGGAGQLKATAGDGSLDVQVITDWDLATALDVRPTAPGQPATLTLEFPRPYAARSMLLHTMPLGASGVPVTPSAAVTPATTVLLEVSDDGVAYRKVAEVAVPAVRSGLGGVGTNVPIVASFPLVTGRFFRVGSPQGRRIAELHLSEGARIADWPAKTNLARRPNQDQYADQNQVAAGADGPAIDPASVVDISRYMDAEGRLRWQAPAGRWTILRIGHTPTGRMQNAASDAGLGLEIDKFDADAMEFHFDKYFGNLQEAFRPLAAKGLVGALIDSYEVGMQNWTPKFPQEFRARRGYDLVQYLPAMTGRIVGSREVTERFLWDIRRAQADVMADNYYGKFAELCRRHGIKSHTEPYGPSNGPFDELQVGSKVDMPMGEFWLRQAGAQWGWSMKLGSSIAHVWNKPVIGAETFTGRADDSKWQEHPYATKAIGDLMYTRGLNHFIFHRYAHQPHPDAAPGMTMGPWGFHFDRTNTWFEKTGPWLQYVARAQYMLRQGQFVGDLLYVNPETAPSEMPDNSNASKVPLTPAPPEGHDYDVIHGQALIQRGQAERGRIVLPDGMSYRLLVLQPTKGVSIELARKLRELVRRGAWLVGTPPAYSFGLANSARNDAELRAIVAELWGDGTGTGTAGRPVGEGRVFRPQPLRTVLDELQVPPDFLFSSRSADRDIRYIHRRVGGADIYFVTNHQRRSEDIVASFRVTGKRPEIFDAVAGTITPVAAYEVDQDRVRVPIRLEPSGSVFVVFRAPASAGAVREIAMAGRTLISTDPFTAPSAAPYDGVVGNFTLSAWIKPEIELQPGVGDFGGSTFMQEATEGMVGANASNFVVHPPEGDTLYGPGHSAAGFTAGRNGIVVYERARALFAPVAAAPIPIAGWTHVALVYRDGAPSVYVGGRLVRTGKPSGRKVHPGLGSPDGNTRFVHFEGDNSEPTLFREVLSEERIRQLAAAVPDPEVPPAVEVSRGEGAGLLVWRNGEYTIRDAAGRVTPLRVEGLAEPAEVTGAWRVTFPPKLGAPAQVTLPRLVSLDRHEEPGVRYFSGTATYHNTFQLPAGGTTGGRRLFLDLGRVEVLAEVIVNGRNLGIAWKAPYRVDITSAVRPGTNRLELRVTNLWPNRLIGDEQLPEEYAFGPAGPANAPSPGTPGGGSSQGTQNAIRAIPAWFIDGTPKPAGERVTFTTWKHHRKDAPLLASGLLGPVRVLAAQWRPLRE